MKLLVYRVITDSVNKQITDGSTPHLYRISLTDTTQAKNLAQYAYNVLGKKCSNTVLQQMTLVQGLKMTLQKSLKA